ncbi:hypothetical protein [Erythrobacter sp. THAF29]|uniref:hypothetical protein n=1 Tax=Erythrobacter sp. THAF29 TaxID=2587851 RepID=UPI0012681D51|nr:hypothetical protein [Erythrobacter sp. THAF29]QFT78398.1 hypothetical protein FIU90_12680 [Erythrobacter sp. THAF29]
MYSEDDINSAVAAGALSPEAAQSFRAHMTEMRALPRSSEEDFRLINSFNDIFVSIGIVILLLAVGAIGQAIAGAIAPADDFWALVRSNPQPTPEQMEAWREANNLKQAWQISLTGLFVAATAWPLAEFFTRKRRMALPSIILLLAFVGGTFATVLGLAVNIVENGNDQLGAVMIALAALIAAVAAFVHWKRFMVPITVAAGAAAVAATVIALAIAAISPNRANETLLLSLVFVAGLAVFAFAMRWDISDRERTTRRSDVAFWLHLLAAPMIAHPIFSLIGVTEGDNIGVGAAFGVVAVYIGFGLIALAIDRRALLVSALAYVLFALTFLFREFGAVELNFALTALVIGSALLSLSAFWQPIRRSVVSALPENIRAALPLTSDAPVPVANATTA